MRFRSPFSVLAALALVVGACGGDDDDVTADDASTTIADSDATGDDDTSETETEEEADDEATDGERSDQQLAADQEVADGAVLTLADVPAGWEETSSDDEEGVDQEAVAECVGADVEELYDDEDPEADTTFESPDDSSVDSGITIAATVELAEFRFETLTSDDALDCLREQILDEMATSAATEGMEIGDVTINRMSAGSVGDDSTAVRITVPVTIDGTDVEVYVDSMFFRTGRAIGTVAYMAVFSPAATDELEGFAQAMDDRIDPAAVS